MRTATYSLQALLSSCSKDTVLDASRISDCQDGRGAFSGFLSSKPSELKKNCTAELAMEAFIGADNKVGEKAQARREIVMVDFLTSVLQAACCMGSVPFATARLASYESFL